MVAWSKPLVGSSLLGFGGCSSEVVVSWWKGVSTYSVVVAQWWQCVFVVALWHFYRHLRSERLGSIGLAYAILGLGFGSGVAQVWHLFASVWHLLFSLFFGAVGSVWVVLGPWWQGGLGVTSFPLWLYHNFLVQPLLLRV